MNFIKNSSSPKKGLNKIGFIYYNKIIYTKKPLGYLYSQFISDFYFESIDFSKIVNCLKNPGLLKEKLNKIGFIIFKKSRSTKKRAK